MKAFCSISAHPKAKISNPKSFRSLWHSGWEARLWDGQERHPPRWFPAQHSTASAFSPCTVSEISLRLSSELLHCCCRSHYGMAGNCGYAISLIMRQVSSQYSHPGGVAGKMESRQTSRGKVSSRCPSRSLFSVCFCREQV